VGDFLMNRKIIIAFVILCILLVFTACGEPHGDPAGVQGSTSEVLTSRAETTTAETEAPFDPTPDESEPQTGDTAESTNTGNTTSSSSGQAAGTSSKPAGTTSKPVSSGSAASSKPDDKPPATSKPADPPPASSAPANPVYTEADYNAIIAEARQYAQSKTKVTFIYDNVNRLTMDNAGYYGTPNLIRDGYDGVIKTLKFHIDKIENLAYSQSGEGAIATYRIIWFELTQTQPTIAFVVLYG